MAEPTVEVVETEEKEIGKGKTGGIKRLLMLLIPAILIPAIAGAGIAYTQFETFASVGTMVGLDFGTKNVEEVEEPETYGEFVQLDGMIINPADSQGKRYLLISIGMESLEPLVLAEIEQKDVVVRDVILKVLGARTVAELTDIGQRNGLKEEIRLAINEVLSAGAIDRMYFTQYVLQ